MIRISDKFIVFGAAFIIVVVSFYVASKFIRPAPPDHLTIASGSKDGAYMAFAKQYKSALNQQGITATIIETAGSIENINKLKNGEADIAFIQGGLASGSNIGKNSNIENIEALSSVYLEPLWVFIRAESQTTSLLDLKGKSLSIGQKGSGTAAISEKLLHDTGVLSDSTIHNITAAEGIKNIESGASDALFIVSGWKSPTIQKLLHNPKLKLMHFKRADAYTKLYPFLSKVTIPEGVVDISRNIPDSNIDILSPTAMLVANKEFHPALQNLLTHTAFKIHQNKSFLAKDNSFPTLNYIDIPISEEAKRYYEFGPSILQRYLPFWAADMLDRLKVMLIPLLTIMLPIIKIIMPAYEWRIKSRIKRWYKKLREIENKLSKDIDSAERKKIITQLEQINEEIKKSHMPLSHSDALYNLRLHVELVEGKISSATTKETKLKNVA